MTERSTTPADMMIIATRAVSEVVVRNLDMMSAALRAHEPKPEPMTPVDLAQAWWQGPVAFANAFTAGMFKPSYGIPTMPFKPPMMALPFNPFQAANDQAMAAMKPFTDVANATAAQFNRVTKPEARRTSASIYDRPAPDPVPLSSGPFAAYQSAGGHASAQVVMAPMTDFVAETTRVAVEAQAAMMAPWLKAAGRKG